MSKTATPAQAAPAVAPQTLRGIGLAALGYGCFSLQDATVKWLVAAYPVPEILLLRSLVIVAVALLIGGRRDIAQLRHSRSKGSLALRSATILVAWLAYYSAASSLQLAQLTTLYFAAPLVAVLLCVVILGERVAPVRWAAVLVGFAGVVLAADPGGAVPWRPAALALFAACCWGLSVVLVRLINRTETTADQMLVTNSLFVLACALMTLGHWRAPDPFSLALMLGIGVTGGLGQFCLYEDSRHAPASVLAPIEYTGLLWAFVFGFVIWGERPGFNVFAGAGLIAGGSLMLVWAERPRSKRAAAGP